MEPEEDVVDVDPADEPDPPDDPGPAPGEEAEPLGGALVAPPVLESDFGDAGAPAVFLPRLSVR